MVRMDKIRHHMPTISENIGTVVKHSFNSVVILRVYIIPFGNKGTVRCWARRLIQRSALADSKALADNATATTTAYDRLNAALGLFPIRDNTVPMATPLVHWTGLLLTALAGMLGGPFWFDLLQKLVNLRAAAPKPAKAARDGNGA